MPPGIAEQLTPSDAANPVLQYFVEIATPMSKVLKALTYAGLRKC